MGAVTYLDDRVIQFIENTMIPLQVLYDHRPLSIEFAIKWTPTVLTLDADGKEHHRTVGFLGPEELIPSLLLGIGKAHFDRGEFTEAISKFDRVIADYPKSDATSEAIFYRGVALYKNTKDPKPLRAAYDLLAADYPGSEWTKRAYPYRLIG